MKNTCTIRTTAPEIRTRSQPDCDRSRVGECATTFQAPRDCMERFFFTECSSRDPTHASGAQNVSAARSHSAARTARLDSIRCTHSHRVGTRFPMSSGITETKGLLFVFGSQGHGQRRKGTRQSLIVPASEKAVQPREPSAIQCERKAVPLYVHEGRSKDTADQDAHEHWQYPAFPFEVSRKSCRNTTPSGK